MNKTKLTSLETYKLHPTISHWVTVISLACALLSTLSNALELSTLIKYLLLTIITFCSSAVVLPHLKIWRKVDNKDGGNERSTKN